MYFADLGSTSSVARRGRAALSRRVGQHIRARLAVHRHKPLNRGDKHTSDAMRHRKPRRMHCESGDYCVAMRRGVRCRLRVTFSHREHRLKPSASPSSADGIAQRRELGVCATLRQSRSSSPGVKAGLNRTITRRGIQLRIWHGHSRFAHALPHCCSHV